MARIMMPDDGALTPRQREVCREAVSGPRGKVPAPMIAWLRNPELARRGQMLGELLRFNTSLEPMLTEMVILVCARHWTSHHEWTAHKALALAAGLDAGIVAAIAARAEPVFADDRLALAHRLASAMLRSGRLTDALYAEGTALLGELGMVEIVAVLGYYCWVSLTLNIFELGLPESRAADLDDRQP
jgi:4-carboxymuconolactone decarboxylase